MNKLIIDTELKQSMTRAFRLQNLIIDARIKIIEMPNKVRIRRELQVVLEVML